MGGGIFAGCSCWCLIISQSTSLLKEWNISWLFSGLFKFVLASVSLLDAVAILV